jgi:predicted neuraminidase
MPKILDRRRASAILLLCTIAFWMGLVRSHAAPGSFSKEPIFPAEAWHNHASCIVETPKGDLLACWFHGTGERTADDVRVEGARLRTGSKEWSERFVMADTPGFPDCNPCLFIDPRGQLWLFHITIIANQWESSLLKYQTSSDYESDGAPRWTASEVLHFKPGKEFQESVDQALPKLLRDAEAVKPRLGQKEWREVEDYLHAFQKNATNKLYCRLGWMSRNHPVALDGGRLLVPVYHDGFSCSLFAITDDWGGHWHSSAPLIGGGNIQPSVALRKDGSLYALMRDNGPPPHRAHQSESHDRGETWSAVTDSEIPNPGSSLELIGLKSGRWLCVCNDTEEGRNSLAAWLSDDEGRSWRWKRHIAQSAKGLESFSYPSVMQSRDGALHVTYSDAANSRSTIMHARFDENWIVAGD